jgi:hypothetical protein
LYYSSYYDQIGKTKQETNKKEKAVDLKDIPHNYKLSTRINKIITKHVNNEIEPEYLYFKLKEDMPKLEKYIQDPKYRKELERDENLEICYSFYQNYELIDLLGLEKKVKEKLKIPENSILKYESIKCSKKCRHNTHQYFYAYFWDPLTKKLKKKYIGKHLPYPFSFDITLRTE